VTDKNHPDETVLTIVQGKGTLPREQAGRNIHYDDASLSNYKMVQKGDFIIHLRSFEGGLEMANENGIVSPAYTILRGKKPHSSRFYEAYFHTDEFVNHVLSKSVEGIRDGRQISYDAFKWIGLPYCSPSEQAKIAELFSVLTQRIEKQTALVDSLKKYKRGAIDGLLSRKLHFQTTSSWREMKISELFSTISEKGYDNLTVLTIVQGAGTQPRESVERRISYDKSNTNTYKRVLENDFILHLRSFEGGLEIANSEGIVSPAYTILRAKEQIIPLFYYAYFRSYWFISNKLRIAVEGIRDGKSINMETFWNISIPCPPIKEQKHIAEYLLCLDTKLKKAESILDRLKAIKNGFSQQLFI
jgi:type I restriction enzyme, S subunit